MTSCLLTFVTRWSTNAAACVANNESAIALVQAVSTTTALTLNASASFAGNVVSYICIGRL